MVFDKHLQTGLWVHFEGFEQSCLGNAKVVASHGYLISVKGISQKLVGLLARRSQGVPFDQLGYTLVRQNPTVQCR